MNRNKTLVTIIIVLLLSNITTVIICVALKDGSRRPDKRRSPMTEFLQKEVGFTPEQLRLFDSLKQRHHTIVKPLGEDLSRSRDSLYNLMGKPATTDSAVQAAAAVIGRKQSALELQLYDNFRQIRAICTPAQLPKFDSLAPSLVRKMMFPRRPSNQKKPDSSKLAR